MIVKTGILCIPAIDAQALDTLRQVLLAGAPQAVVLLESAAGSQRNWIAETLRQWCDEEEMDLVLTVGGTLPAVGTSSQEIVPEATLEVVERLLPGLAETMRAEAIAENPLAILDRSVAGIRGRTLILNLPEGGAAALFLHSVVDLIPPVVAHLQGRPDAPRLADLDAGAALAAGSAEPPPSPRKRLDAGEFAAWLRLSGSTGDEAA